MHEINLQIRGELTSFWGALSWACSACIFLFSDVYQGFLTAARIRRRLATIRSEAAKLLMESFTIIMSMDRMNLKSG